MFYTDSIESDEYKARRNPDIKSYDAAKAANDRLSLGSDPDVMDDGKALTCYQAWDIFTVNRHHALVLFGTTDFGFYEGKPSGDKTSGIVWW